jgi:metal-sulfur cluster biosynthetic enzyme
MPNVEEVREALKDVQDPELQMGIIDLGLIYDFTVDGPEGEDVGVLMKLTSPMCPVGPQFKASVEDKVKSLPGVKTAKVEITFSPPWDPREMASEDVKQLLGIW